MTKVLVNFIQDRSGSMAAVWEEALSGFKAFVEDLRSNGDKDGVEYLFSLTTFDTQIDTPLIAVPIKDVDVDVLKEYGPRGGTALYDAVGVTIKNTEDNRHNADKIICVVVTDGQENSSRKWTKDMLHKSIEAKLTAGDWTFTYLGTQPETWDDAGAIGVGAGAVASYDPTMAKAAYATTSHAVRSMSRSSAMGTRSLMSDHVADTMASASGMKVDRGGTKGRTPLPHTSPPQSATSKTSTTRRWK